MFEFIFTLAEIVGNWQTFKKMGREGWESIVPFYNTYVLFETLYGNGWQFLTLLIPFYGIYVYFKLWIDVAAGFNKSTGFGIGLALLQPVFICLVGFSSEYVWKDGSVPYQEDFIDNIFGKNHNQ